MAETTGLPPPALLSDFSSKHGSISFLISEKQAFTAINPFFDLFIFFPIIYCNIYSSIGQWFYTCLFYLISKSGKVGFEYELRIFNYELVNPYLIG